MCIRDRIYEAMQEKAWGKLRKAAYHLHVDAGYLGMVRFSDIARNMRYGAEPLWSAGVNGDISEDLFQKMCNWYTDLMVEAKVVKIVIGKYLRREPNFEMIDTYLQYKPGETERMTDEALDKNREEATQSDEQRKEKKICEIFQQLIKDRDTPQAFVFFISFERYLCSPYLTYAFILRMLYVREPQSRMCCLFHQ
eukprot:TRINITY_DN7163_c0_g1_i1.p1 TRINITY_DN7163_c0_g1~~TRINITY_DN7163_c0_g1_i1.p1  ORF type:complete len:215 (+),score=21.09 TRINITY_DN7163_c0_g1_i1:61-645(+)